MRLRARVLTAAAVLAAVALGTFAILLAGLQAQRDAAVRGRGVTRALAAAGTLQRLTLDMESGVRGYALTGEDRLLAPYERARAQLPAAGARLARDARDDGALVARLRSGEAGYANGYLAGVVREVRARSPQVRSVQSALAGQARFDAVRGELDRFVAVEQAEQIRLRGHSTALRNRAIAIAAGGLVVLMALIWLLALAAIRAIVRPAERLERLQAATAALAAAVGVDDVARAVVDQSALGATRATLLLRDGDVLRLAEARGLPPEDRARFGIMALAAELPAAECARRGAAVFGHDRAELEARWPALEPIHQAYAALPLVASGGQIGVLALAFDRAMAFDAGERALLEALAAQCAVALARAQLYEREHTVSRTLQASLLPAALPDVPGLDLAARLAPGAVGVEVGGDFYDAFVIADGVWGIAIGDVCGKGVDAAALTALARHTVRAAARAEASPAAVLEALNRAALDVNRPGQFLTAVFGRLTARPGGGFVLVLACGGHPPPVLLDAELRPRALDCAGTLLGVVEDPEVADCVAELAPGDTLLLYTDGLTEAAAPVRTLTTGDLAAVLATVRGETAAQTAGACLDRAMEDGGGVVRDDVAVLVAQLPLAARSTAGRTPAGESSTAGQ